MDIISKFTVGSEKSIDQLFDLKKIQLKEMYQDILDHHQLDIYIKTQLNRRDAINELNDLSTQMITVFVDDEPVGYAIIKSSFNQPKILDGKKAVELSSFFILSEHNNYEIRLSLWQKCFSVTRSYCHWIEILQNNPLISFLEGLNFRIHEKLKMKPFEVPSYLMIREIN
ncbi:hypothetical protein ASG22_18620 [Chryseobacterium sp. Leaf405]|uniref:hypothetical protein n=1 Tax=Chryseobacterium sp. Leaf405 TaxID=1736367 RepID=UPI000701BC41|nr:hypothetical protein [Chryseobacterium sp. Leaf405]KQT31537.1 hypothetical protein ASG22_18620 [Chryseobacterium sp. Leaf405]